jgi:stage III sporulation protein AA
MQKENRDTLNEKLTFKTKIIESLGKRVKNEIFHTLSRIRRGSERLVEIRLRAYGTSSLVFDDCTLPLSFTLDTDGLSRIAGGLLGDSLYAYRDAILNGYIPLPHGVRVGVSGAVSYDGGRQVGVEEISTLAFRFPTGECEGVEAIAEAFFDFAKRGMLIFSAPGIGKTTALRSLARRLGGEGGLRVAVVDTRLEFIPEDYKGCFVDLLRGYGKREGFDVALRALNPEVILTDEIGARDGDGIRRAVSSGVPVIATVHAGSISEMTKRLTRLGIEPELFDVAVNISREGTAREFTVYPLVEGCAEDIPCRIS